MHDALGVWAFIEFNILYIWLPIQQKRLNKILIYILTNQYVFKTFLSFCFSKKFLRNSKCTSLKVDVYNRLSLTSLSTQFCYQLLAGIRTWIWFWNDSMLKIWRIQKSLYMLYIIPLKSFLIFTSLISEWISILLQLY